MRIGWVAPGGFDRSGTQKVIPALLWLLERTARNSEVDVFAIRQGRRVEVFPLLGASIHEMGCDASNARGPASFSRTLSAIRRAHDNRPYDVLHGFWASQSGLIAVIAGRRIDVPVVLTVGGGELARLPEVGYGGSLSMRGRLFANFSLRRARSVLVASEFAAQPARAIAGTVQIVPLGADISVFSPAAELPDRAPWKLTQISNLNRVKDQPTLLNALRCTLDEEPNVRLEVIGADTLHGKIQRLSVKMGLETRVEFRGPIPSGEVADVLRRSHLLVHTSRHESGPVAFLEAAACGIATVGTAVGHLADLAPHAAATVPVGDFEGLARAIVSLLRNRDERAAIAERARAFALTHDADWTANRIAQIYEAVANKEPLPVER